MYATPIIGLKFTKKLCYKVHLDRGGDVGSRDEPLARLRAPGDAAVTGSSQILCRIQQFILQKAGDRVRQLLLLDLLEPPSRWMK